VCDGRVEISPAGVKEEVRNPPCKQASTYGLVSSTFELDVGGLAPSSLDG